MFPTGMTLAEQKRLMAIHKAAVKKYETCLGISNALKAKNCKAVELIYLKEIKHKTFKFDEVTVLKMLQHIHERGRDLDYVDRTELNKKCNSQ